MKSNNNIKQFLEEKKKKKHVAGGMTCETRFKIKSIKENLENSNVLERYFQLHSFSIDKWANCYLCISWKHHMEWIISETIMLMEDKILDYHIGGGV